MPGKGDSDGILEAQAFGTSRSRPFSALPSRKILCGGSGAGHGHHGAPSHPAGEGASQGPVEVRNQLVVAIANGAVPVV